MSFSNFTSQITQTPPSSIPGLLWALYLEYLWNYESNSWVARTAYAARVLAFLISLPFIIFALLDITSYILARTLGIVDVVKASTSDKVTVHNTATSAPPHIHVQAESPNINASLEDSIYSESDRSSNFDHNTHNASRSSLASSVNGEYLNGHGLGLGQGSHATTFYAGGEDNHNGNLKLAGVGVFSPMASQPPSPTLSRQQLSPEVKEQLRHRTHQIVEQFTE